MPNRSSTSKRSQSKKSSRQPSIAKRNRDPDEGAAEMTTSGSSTKRAPLRHLLPQNLTGEARIERRLNINTNKDAYQWDEDNGWMPRGLVRSKGPEGLPKREGPGFSDAASLTKTLHATTMFGPQNKLLDAKMYFRKYIQAAQQKLGIKSFEDEPLDVYSDLYAHQFSDLCDYERPVPKIAQDNLWATDEEFGREKTSGINPLLIRKCSSLSQLQKKMPVKDADIKGLIGNYSLKDLDKAGRLYVVDYEFLEGVQKISLPPPTGIAWFYVPILLLWLNDDEKLMPLAIQLQQDPEKSPVYTPNDDLKYDDDDNDRKRKNPQPNGNNLWLLAKCAFNQTETSYLISCSHIGDHHLAFETVYMAAMRTIGDDHPINQVLRDSFWFTLTINLGIKNRLMGPTGDLSTLFSQGYEGLKELVKRDNRSGASWNRYIIQKDIAERQVHDLPGYCWRDDCLEGWSIWESFVNHLLDNLYDSDEDILADTEIQYFANECSTKMDFSDLPMEAGMFKTKEQLKEFLTTVLFNVTFRHSSIHMTQWDLITYAPNCPAILRKPVPTDKTGESCPLSQETLVAEFLPDLNMMIRQVSFFTSVTFPPSEEYRVGHFTKNFLPKGLDQAAGDHLIGQALQTEMQGKLQLMAERINLRNAQQKMPYNYVNPEQVWRSICM